MPKPTHEHLGVDTIDDISALPPDVRALFDLAEAEDLQYGLDWFLNLTATVFTDQGQWCMHVLRRAGKAVAVVPLRVDRLRGHNNLHSLSNYYTTLFALPLASDVTPQELAYLLSLLRRRHSPLASLTIAPLDPAARSARYLLESLRLSGYLAYEYECFGNWYLPVAGDGARYLASRPGEVRSTLRRMGKKFTAEGGRLEIHTAASPALIDAFVRVYGTSWKQPEPYPAFIPGLMRLCDTRKWLRLGMAWMGSRPVAAQLWMVAGGKASIYKLAYDPQFKQFSPGSLLTAALMQHVIDQDRVQEIDYLSGDDAYKQSWMSHRRQRSGIVAFDPRTPSGLWGAARQTLGHAMQTSWTKLRQRISTHAS